MSKQIIEDSYYLELKDKLSPAIEELIKAFSLDSKIFSNSERFTTEYLSDKILQDIGCVIPVSLAWKKLINFSPTPDDNKKVIPISLVKEFIKCLKDMEPYEDYELGIRIHMGYSNHGAAVNYFLMPIWIYTDGHEYDLEESIFSNDTAFFGIDADDTSKFIKDYKRKQKVKYKDDSGKTGVIFSLNTLEDFLSGYDETLSYLEILSARETKSKYGSLTLVVRGIDSEGRILISDGKSIGYYFDQGDLIPPPPVNDTSF